MTRKKPENFFREAQLFSKQQSTLPNFCKDKHGNILSEHQDILQRWKQYFCDLQSLNDCQTEIDIDNVTFNNMEEVPPSTYHEINQVI
jgi:hypothetical protein